MRPDRSDFIEPGDLIERSTFIEGIASLVVNDIGWSWTHLTNRTPLISQSTLGITISMSASHHVQFVNSDLEEIDHEETSAAGHVRYVLFSTCMGWWLHDELTMVEKVI